MLDLKTIQTVLGEFEERGITKETMIEAIESALATAYKKEYGKRGQIVRARLDMNTGTSTFEQVKTVVDESLVRVQEETEDEHEDFGRGDSEDAEGELPRFDTEKHIMLEDARRIKRDAQLGDEIVFPLESLADFGRIAAQTAKQVIIQKIREAEKLSVLGEFSTKKGQVVSGIVQRVERGSMYIDLGRATGVIPYEEQIPGERFRPGERIRAYLNNVDEGFRGVYLRLSRAHPKFLLELFKQEVPELSSGTIEVKSIAREPGSRTKIAIASSDPHIDPIGALVGQRGVRVSTVMQELGGERIDIIEWNDDAKEFIKESLSPATVLEVTLNEEEHKAAVTVSHDQQSLAIGRGGQNVRLAARLTGWSIDITSLEGENVAESDGNETPLPTEAAIEDAGGESVAVASPESPEEHLEAVEENETVEHEEAVATDEEKEAV